ncbi:MAG: hypoxanthine phosphoribosyltransferase [Rikenellaceae bacterium]
MYRIDDKCFKEFISAEQIAQRVSSIAEQINSDYAAGKFSGLPLIVSVLNGSAIFCCDLIRELNFEFELSFVKISSYNGTESTGCPKRLIGLNTDLKGRDVIVIEDIVETGISIDSIDCDLREKGAENISVCTLTFKQNRYRGNRAIDYIGFEIEDEFIVGYGMDYMERGRGLSEILVVADE